MAEVKKFHPKAYAPSEAQWRRLQNNFDYHPPIGDQADRYIAIRAAAKELAHTLMTLCPDSRELSLALGDIEDAAMHANAAIARNEKKEDFVEKTT